MKRTDKKAKRKLLGGLADPLSFTEKESSFEYRVFNDDPLKQGRIQMAKEAGWEVVTGENDLGVSTADTAGRLGSGVTRPVGNGVTGVLMRKPRDWYEEDQNEKQKLVDETEAVIRRNMNEGNKYGKLDVTRK